MPTAHGQQPRGRRGLGVAAICCVALAAGLLMQSSGWAAVSNYALVRALAHGTAKVDPYHWETKDVSWYRGHYYSVKAPLMPALTVPLYKLLAANGAQKTAYKISRDARMTGAWRWRPGISEAQMLSTSRIRTYHMRGRIEESTPIVWTLGLIGNVLPALILMLLVRRVADRYEPGYGTAAAVTLGLATMILPFSTLFFSHVLSATLAFAAFALLLRERDGPPRRLLLALAGLLAGLAFSAEYPIGIAGVVLGGLAVARPGRVGRGLSYAGGWLLGSVPLWIYNAWAFGSPLHFSYSGAVVRQGVSGHDQLGLNDSGFFGINLPSPRVLAELLLASKGLLVLTPVLAAAVAGLVLLYRRGRRTEAWTVGALAVAYLVYNSGYWLPFGGGTPGPRFLVILMPFLAIGLAPAYRRLPATTLALAAPSALFMIAATLTYPLLTNNNVGFWSILIGASNFENTVFTPMGAGHDWAGVWPLLVLFAAAAILAVAATGRAPRPRLDWAPALAATAAWALVAAAGPWLLNRDSALSGDGGFAVLIGVGAAGALAAVAIAAIARRVPALTARRSRLDARPSEAAAGAP